MVGRIKADLRKHWVSWTGFAGLMILFLVYLFWNPGQIFMVILFWVLTVWGMAIESGIEKQYGYRTDKERNKPYE